MYRYFWEIGLDNPSKAQEFIDHWRESSKIIQEYPGALGTHMHEVRDKPGHYFAIAEWESIAARDAMQEDIEAGISECSKRWLEFPKNQSFGTIIGFAGVEIEVVLPE